MMPLQQIPLLACLFFSTFLGAMNQEPPVIDFESQKMETIQNCQGNTCVDVLIEYPKAVGLSEEVVTQINAVIEETVIHQLAIGAPQQALSIEGASQEVAAQQWVGFQSDFEQKTTENWKVEISTASIHQVDGVISIAIKEQIKMDGQLLHQKLYWLNMDQETGKVVDLYDRILDKQAFYDLVVSSLKEKYTLSDESSLYKYLFLSEMNMGMSPNGIVLSFDALNFITDNGDFQNINIVLAPEKLKNLSKAP